MGHQVIWTSEAIDDLRRIVAGLAPNHPRAAAKLGKELISKSLLLAEHPQLGKIRPADQRGALREIVVRPCRLIYEIDGQSLSVKVRMVWPETGSAPEIKMNKHFKAIAAMSLNRVIGAGNQIPWHLPADFKWFKQLTTGNVVIMGRKTFESLGKPLPNRINIVLSRHPGRLQRDFPEIFGQAWVARGKTHLPERPPQFELPKMGGTAAVDLRIIKDIMQLDPASSPLEFYIAGGAQIYEQALPFCSDIYLTLVQREVEGDAFFPPFEDQFELVETLRDEPEFKILHYRHRSLPAPAP